MTRRKWVTVGCGLLALLALVLVAGGLLFSLMTGSGYFVWQNTRDTCRPGQNMSNPQLLYDPSPVTDVTDVVLTWETGTEVGAQLGQDYFAAVTVVDPTATVQAVTLSDWRQITIQFRDLPAYLAAQSSLADPMQITLVFPDRETYTDCRHPGMADVYQLQISIWFTDEFAIREVAFEEAVLLGPM